MKQLIMTKGLPGSGKSTWARQTLADNPGAYKIINKDLLREMLDNGKHSSANEKFILNVRDMLVRAAFEDGKHAIVDDTNLAPKHETRLRQLAKECGAQFSIQDFCDVPLETCIKQDLRRDRSVGQRVITGMYDVYLKPEPPVIVRDPALPNAIICDLDGTLALLNGRDPYDASTCGGDCLNEPVAAVVRALAATDVLTIFTSGRKDTWRAETIGWLHSHGFGFGRRDLYMRRADDNRPDEIVKREMYDEISAAYNVLLALDDRDKVVRMWRSLGLTCFQVAEGDF